MGCIFKHVGQFAYLNDRGDLRVRPSYVDVRLDVMRTSSKVKHHLCEAYRQAFVAVRNTHLQSTWFVTRRTAAQPLVQQGLPMPCHHSVCVFSGPATFALDFLPGSPVSTEIYWMYTGRQVIASYSHV
jgi:hypothetical protein